MDETQTIVIKEQTLIIPLMLVLEQLCPTFTGRDQNSGCLPGSRSEKDNLSFYLG